MTYLLRVIHDLVTQAPQALFNHFPSALTGVASFYILLAVWKKSEILELIDFEKDLVISGKSLVFLFRLMYKPIILP